MSASDGHRVSIYIGVLTWARLVRGLRIRGAGERESGAFLLGQRGADSAKVRDFRFYDDLDPSSLDSGGISFHAVGYSALWTYCRKRKLEVLADIHTHPGPVAAQSSIDRRNPMIPVRGHVAIVLPNYAQIRLWSLKPAAVYEYEGDYRWRQCNIEGAPKVLKLRVW